MALRQRAQQSEMSPVNGQAETDYGQSGKNPDEHRKNEKENFFVEGAFQPGKQSAREPLPWLRKLAGRRWHSNRRGGAHCWVAASRFCEINNNASSIPCGGPQVAAFCCSIWKTRSIIVSGKSVSAGERSRANSGFTASHRACNVPSGEVGNAVFRSNPLFCAHSVNRFSACAKAAAMRRLRSTSEIW